MSKRLLALLLIVYFVVAIPCQASAANTATPSDNNEQEIVVQQKEPQEVASTSATQETTLIKPGSHIYIKLTNDCPSGLYHNYKEGEHPWARGKWGRGSLGYRAYKCTSDGNGFRYGFVTCGHGFEYSANDEVYVGDENGPETLIGTVVTNGIESPPTDTYYSDGVLDYAFVELLPGYDISDETLAGIRLSGKGEPEIGMEVFKDGAITGKTHAIVSSIVENGDFEKFGTHSSVVFEGTFRVESSEKFLEHRDSGGVVYSCDGKVLGVVSASDPFKYTGEFPYQSMITSAGIISSWGNARVASGENPITLSVSQDNISGNINLSWNSIPSAAGYAIYRRTGAGAFYSAGGTQGTTFTLPAGNLGELHEYFIYANGVRETLSNIASYKFENYPAPSWRITGNSAEGYPTLEWNPVDGASSYIVYRSESENGVYTQINTVEGTTSFIDDSPYLTIGETYYYKVKANSTYADESELKSVKRIYPTPQWKDKTYSNGKPKLQWNAVKGATEYKVYLYKDDKYTWLATIDNGATSYIHSDAVVGQTYNYAVKVSSGCGSGYSPLLTQVCKYKAPHLIGVVAVSGGQNIQWTSVSGARQYIVEYRKINGGAYETLGVYTGISCQFPQQLSNQVFTYRVRVYNSPYSDNSNEKTYVPVPTWRGSITYSYGYPKLQWNTVSGAVGYEIYRCAEGSSAYTLHHTIKKGSTDYYIDSKTELGKKYSYKIKALGGGTASAFSSDRDYTRKYEYPYLMYTGVSYGKPYLVWCPVTGATEYKVYRSTDSSTGYEVIAEDITGTYYKDATAKPGVTYYYKLQACNDAKPKANSELSTYRSRICQYAYPEGFAINYSYGQPKLSWKAVTGANEYKVYRSNSEYGTYTEIAKISATEYRDRDTDIGGTYFYKITAGNTAHPKAESERSHYLSKKCIYAYPGWKSPTYYYGKPKVQWYKVDGATEYTVYRSDSAYGPYTPLKPTSETSYVDEDADIGKTYYYKVKVSEGQVENIQSELTPTYKCVTCKYAYPKFKDITLSSTGKPYLTWYSVSGASKYEVYRSTSATSGYSKIGSPTTTSFIDESARVGETYYYKLKVSEGTVTGAQSGLSLYKYYEYVAPIIDTYEYRGNDYVYLNWTSVAGASYYVITRTSGSDTKTITSYTLSYSDYDVLPRTTYYYQVQAYNSSGSAINGISNKVYVNVDNKSIIARSISIKHVLPQTYTGSEVQQHALEVYDGNVRLVEGVDYYLDYSNNINAATNAMVFIYGKGKYTGYDTRSFTIEPRSIGDCSIYIPNGTYTGNVQTPVPVVTYNGTTVSSSDYYVVTSVIGVGEHTIRIEGRGNFTGIADRTVTINCKTPTLLSVSNLGNNQVKLEWTNDGGATHYRIWRSDGVTRTVIANHIEATSSYKQEYTDRTAYPGKTYVYEVQAYVFRDNDIPDYYSSYSNTASITK